MSIKNYRHKCTLLDKHCGVPSGPLYESERFSPYLLGNDTQKNALNADVAILLLSTSLKGLIAVPLVDHFFADQESNVASIF